MLAIGLYLINVSIFSNTTLDVWVKKFMLVLFDISAVLQLYYFLLSSYRGNFMYWVILAIYFVSGVTVFILTKINGDYAMIVLFVLFAISFVPSANVQMQMRREPPPEDFFKKYFD